MRQSSYLAVVAPPTLAVVRNIKADQLDLPTPCAEWSVRDLVDHLLQWAPALVAAAGKEDTGVPEPVRSGEDWAVRLESGFERLVTVWSRPEAWQGTTTLGGPTPLPASMVGGMVLGEFVLHGWDLARATGQRPEWADEPLNFLYEETERIAELGRGMGVYGPAVPVPATAPVLARTLGLTGRDPGWLP